MQKDSKQREEGWIILLLIISIGTVILGAVQNSSTLIFSGVAVLLLDTVLLLDHHERHYPNEVKQE